MNQQMFNGEIHIPPHNKRKGSTKSMKTIYRKLGTSHKPRSFMSTVSQLQNVNEGEMLDVPISNLRISEKEKSALNLTSSSDFPALAGTVHHTRPDRFRPEDFPKITKVFKATEREKRLKALGKIPS